MNFAILVFLALVVLAVLVVLQVFAQHSGELRTAAVPETGVPEAGPVGPTWPGVGERRRAVSRPVQGYCVKDRAMVEMLNPQPAALRTGRLATVGVCPSCGTTIYKIEKTPVIVKATARVREDRERIVHGRRETA